MTKIYLDKFALAQFGLDNACPAQRTSLEKLLQNGFNIYRVLQQDKTTLVLVSHPNTFGVVYPDGQFHRALKGRKTVALEWGRAHFLQNAQNAVNA